MACRVCGRITCTESFHPLVEQERKLNPEAYIEELEARLADLPDPEAVKELVEAASEWVELWSFQGYEPGPKRQRLESALQKVKR